ncbi:hypothetical protein [Pontibacter harenae]|uniref:hypothetical protein n=1 Tax=Pontibacter harenae TaxID=2894083 RepID=UPI001E617E5F|nr:hypothetical protein [Pontibacter harenae]MCC9166032.1 hypothetical protein [Pontibacter harenae]
MQTAEKVDSKFLLKLSTLFVMLFIGVLLRTPEPVLHASSQPYTKAQNFQPDLKDSIQLQQLYFQMVKEDTYSEASSM